MRYDEFKNELARAGLTVREFAEHIGVSAATVSNYASRVKVPLHFAVVVTLMAEMKQSGLDFGSALSHIERNKQRAASSSPAQKVQQSLFSEPSSEE